MTNPKSGLPNAQIALTNGGLGHLHSPRRGTTDERRTGKLRVLIAIVLRRFGEYSQLEGAFGRRATIERAKGILMERHSVGEDEAFALLRDQAREVNRKLDDIAAAVVDGHALLPKRVDRLVGKVRETA
jgi:ANTAR domain-containing protein